MRKLGENHPLISKYFVNKSMSELLSWQMCTCLLMQKLNWFKVSQSNKSMNVYFRFFCFLFSFYFVTCRIHWSLTMCVYLCFNWFHKRNGSYVYLALNFVNKSCIYFYLCWKTKNSKNVMPLCMQKHLWTWTIKISKRKKDK